MYVCQRHLGAPSGMQSEAPALAPFIVPDLQQSVVSRVLEERRGG